VFVEDECVGSKNQDGRKQHVGPATMRPERDRCHSDDDANSASFPANSVPAQHVIKLPISPSYSLAYVPYDIQPLPYIG